MYRNAAQNIELKKIFRKPCIWSIINILNNTEDKIINITALISKLNSNYSAVSRCIEDMKMLGIIEEIHIGRLRLIKLKEDNKLVKLMTDIIKSFDSIS